MEGANSCTTASEARGVADTVRAQHNLCSAAVDVASLVLYITAHRAGQHGLEMISGSSPAAVMKTMRWYSTG